MSEQKDTVKTLTLEQRRLVRDNIGLVAVHMRRNLADLAVPRRDREWEDLFQEGCLGLIQAAVRYRRERGIPFAAFALPRIHNAVSRALQRSFSTVYVPPPPGKTHRAGPGWSAPDDPRHRPVVFSLDDDQQRNLVDDGRHWPDTKAHETVGDRLRGKYERAARTASRQVAARSSRRGDRAELVALLMEERLLIPNEDARTALRSIARRTSSSYARVAQCERQLKETIGRVLESDTEFQELQRRARACPDGTRRLLDPELETELAYSCCAEFVRRVRHAPQGEKGRLLAALLELSKEDFEQLLRRQVLGLNAEARESLLRVPLCRR